MPFPSSSGVIHYRYASHQRHAPHNSQKKITEKVLFVKKIKTTSV
ncbi:hypothetical protein JSMCR1_p396 (plasmid) [Escherichia coli]|nr:hypothetical protein JSMCR1_p396 [Escherichia coli]